MIGVMLYPLSLQAVFILFQLKFGIEQGHVNEDRIALLPDVCNAEPLGAVMDKQILAFGTNIPDIKIERKRIARFGFKFAAPDTGFQITLGRTYMNKADEGYYGEQTFYTHQDSLLN